MGRANGSSQPVKVAVATRRSAPADAILFGRLPDPIRPAGGKRSYPNEEITNGELTEYWTSEPDVPLEIAQQRDLLHREDGPAYVLHDHEGRVRAEVYHRNGLFHRVDGPAVINYFENGMPFTEQWFLEGQEHREDGPAEIRYDEIAASERQQVIEDENWWTHGQMEDFEDQ